MLHFSSPHIQVLNMTSETLGLVLAREVQKKGLSGALGQCRCTEAELWVIFKWPNLQDCCFVSVCSQSYLSRMWLKIFQSRPVEACVFVCKMWILWVQLSCWAVFRSQQTAAVYFLLTHLSVLTCFISFASALFPPKCDSDFSLTPAVCWAGRKWERERRRNWQWNRN